MIICESVWKGDVHRDLRRNTGGHTHVEDVSPHGNHIAGDEHNNYGQG